MKQQTQSPMSAAGIKGWMRLSLGLLLVMAPVAQAQFALDWFSVDGGGGVSSGGAYSLAGTIGQPDAGVMSGGNYSLTGGFWAVTAAGGAEVSPTLDITPAAPGFVRVSWSPVGPGFTLLASPSLNPSSWTAVPGPITNPMTLPASGATRFYRLYKP